MTSAEKYPKGWRPSADWRRVTGLPLADFAEFQRLLASSQFSLGIDTYIAAQWVTRKGPILNRVLIYFCSYLVYLVSLGVIVVAFTWANYWLLLSLPLMASAIICSEPALPARPLFTGAIFVILLVSVKLLLDGYTTAPAVMMLTTIPFVLGRIISLATVRSFRRALLRSEELFVAMFEQGGCSVRDNQTGQTFSTRLS